MYCACHAKGSRGPAAATAPQLPQGSSMYCACHAKGKCGGSEYCACQAKGRRGPAAATAPQLLKKPLCTAPATQKGSADALCTAPATQKAVAGQRRPPRRSSARKLQVRYTELPGGAAARWPPLARDCLLRGRRNALCTAPATQRQSRAAAATASQLRQEALCTAPATQKGSAEALSTAPARQKAGAGSGGHRAAAPQETSMYCACHAKGKCGRSVYCACHAKGSRGPAAATAPQLRQEALCTAPATQGSCV